MLRNPRRAGSLLLMSLLVFVVGGCGDFCNPLGSVKAKVVLQGDADLALPAPVTLRGVVIGQVMQVTLNAGNRPVLVLCLEKKPARNLGEPTVFYIDRAGTGASLACEPAQTSEKDKTAAQGERVYLGFSSYEDYLAWRSANMLKDGVSGFLDALDQALDSFKEQIQPDAAVKMPQ